MSPLTIDLVRAEGFDERHVVREDDGTDFVVYIYTGSDDTKTSWSVSSHLITDAALPQVLRWLAAELPASTDTEPDPDTITCWSLGIVRYPEEPTAESDMIIAWIVGSDILNTPSASRSARGQLLADEMLTRRHRVTLL